MLLNNNANYLSKMSFYCVEPQPLVKPQPSSLKIIEIMTNQPNSNKSTITAVGIKQKHSPAKISTFISSPTDFKQKAKKQVPNNIKCGKLNKENKRTRERSRSTNKKLSSNSSVNSSLYNKRRNMNRIILNQENINLLNIDWPSNYISITTSAVTNCKGMKKQDMQVTKNKVMESRDNINGNNNNNNNENDIERKTWINNTNSWANSDKERGLRNNRMEYKITKLKTESIQSKTLNQSNQSLNKFISHFQTKPLNSFITQCLLKENESLINFGMNSSNVENWNINILYRTNSNFTFCEYRQLLTSFAMLEYGPSIRDEYFATQEILGSFLSYHEITSKMRTKMINWIIEVYQNIKCSESTFFTTVDIIDRYFKRSKNNHKPWDLHLIGICSFFISSKFCDVYPIKLRLITDKVGHNKYTSDEIWTMEKIILTTLDFDILRPTIYDFSNWYYEEIFSYCDNNYNIQNTVLKSFWQCYIQKLRVQSNFDQFLYCEDRMISKYTDKMKTFLKCIINYLSKMCCHYYEIIREKYSLVAAAVFLVAMKICEEVNSEDYINEYFIEKLEELSRENKDEILALGRIIIYNVQNYEDIYENVFHLYNIYFEIWSGFQSTK